MLLLLFVVVFTLTDRASTIPSSSNTRGCQSGTWSAGQKKIKGTSTKLQWEQKKNKNTKNDKEKGTGITKYTGQKKINEGHSIERVSHSAGREPSDTLPGSQPCTQKTRSIYHIPYSKVSVSLTAQSTSLRESLGWPNQRIVTLGQQYNIVKKPTVILYTYINHYFCCILHINRSGLNHTQ